MGVQVFGPLLRPNLREICMFLLDRPDVPFIHMYAYYIYMIAKDNICVCVCMYVYDSYYIMNIATHTHAQTQMQK